MKRDQLFDEIWAVRCVFPFSLLFSLFFLFQYLSVFVYLFIFIITNLGPKNMGPTPSHMREPNNVYIYIFQLKLLIPLLMMKMPILKPTLSKTRRSNTHLFVLHLYLPKLLLSLEQPNILMCMMLSLYWP